MALLFRFVKKSLFAMNGLRFAFSNATDGYAVSLLRLACHPVARLHSQHPVGRQSALPTAPPHAV